MLTKAAISSRATPEGTARYAVRFPEHKRNDFFNNSKQDLTLSSFGIGTYKGQVSDLADEDWGESIRCGLKNGINVLDTAIRYRAMRSERVIGDVLAELIGNKEVQRDEVFISTKGGLISILEGWGRDNYVEEKIVRGRGISNKEIYKNIHCMSPKFLSNEIDISLENLKLDSVDCYFLHNPELSMNLLGKEEFYLNIQDVFEMLEEEVSNNKIASYGIASWNAFRRRRDSSWYIDIEKILSIAKNVAGTHHHFKYLELPISVGMPFIYNNEIDTSDGRRVSFLDYIQELNLDIFTSASMYEGKLDELFNLQRLMKMAGVSDSENNEDNVQVSLPLSENSNTQLFELLVAARNMDTLLEDEVHRISNNCMGAYPAALNLVRSLPQVTCALAGVEKIKYLEENLQLTRVPKLQNKILHDLFSSLSLRD